MFIYKSISINFKAILPLAPICALLNATAIILYIRSLKIGEMSIVIPLRNTTPLFVVLLSFIFLKEEHSAWLIAASFLIIIGAIIISHKRNKGFHESLRNITKDESIIYALIVALIAAFVFILTKYALFYIDSVIFLFFVTIFSLLFVLLYGLIGKKDYKKVIENIKSHTWIFIIAGIFNSIGTLFTYYALASNNASIVAPTLRMEIVFSVIAGLLFFKEKGALKKIIGSSVILTGIFIAALV